MESWGVERHKVINNMREVVYDERIDLTVIIQIQKLLHEFQKYNSVSHPIELKKQAHIC